MVRILQKCAMAREVLIIMKLIACRSYYRTPSLRGLQIGISSVKELVPIKSSKVVDNSIGRVSQRRRKPSKIRKRREKSCRILTSISFSIHLTVVASNAMPSLLMRVEGGRKIATRKILRVSMAGETYLRSPQTKPITNEVMVEMKWEN